MRRFLRGRLAADLLLWLTMTAPLAFLGSEPPDEPGLPIRWVSLAAVPLLGAAVAVGRRHPVVAAAIPAALGLAATPELYTGTFLIAQMSLAFLLGRRTEGMRAGLLFCGGVCLAGLPLVRLTATNPWQSAFSLVGTVLLTILLPWLVGRYARQQHQLTQAGWELAERLEREHDLVAERTRLLERSRIASDMHDSLGHELSLIALRAATLQVNAGLDGTTHNAAKELRESAAQAAERLQEIIGMLREDSEPAPLLPADDTIASLVGRAAASGLAVTVTGRLEPLPPMADRAAYRLVQEALTNAAKHAPGAAVTVNLATDTAAGQATVSVANGTPPGRPAAGISGGGYGLVGLDERVRLTGGRLAARPRAEGGFVVTARFPLTEGAPATPRGARQELARAQRNVRRSVLDAIWLPAAAGAALAGLMFGYEYSSTYQSVLDDDVYNGLHVGERQSAVEPLLPVNQLEEGRRRIGAPPDPPGADECRIYRTTTFSISPAYRVCFTDSILSSKDTVEIAQP